MDLLFLNTGKHQTDLPRFPPQTAVRAQPERYRRFLCILLLFLPWICTLLLLYLKLPLSLFYLYVLFWTSGNCRSVRSIFLLLAPNSYTLSPDHPPHEHSGSRSPGLSGDQMRQSHHTCTNGIPACSDHPRAH